MSSTLPDPRTRDGLGLAVLAGVVAVAGSYAVVGRSKAFVAVPVHSWEVDTMPAVVLQYSIVYLGELGDSIGFVIALGLTVVIFAVLAGVALEVGSRRSRLAGLATAYLLTWGVSTVFTGRPWVALGPTLAMVAVLGLAGYRPLRTESGEMDQGRRDLLRGLGGLGAVGIGYALGNRTPLGTPPDLRTIGVEDRTVIDEKLAMAQQRSLTVGDLPGLVSSLQDFYEVDIDTVNPGVDTGGWSLTVTGAVDEPLTLSFGDLTDRPTEHRFKTLRCVGEDLNGKKLDTALWTGLPASTLLDEAGLHDDVTHVVLHAVDGYYEEFPVTSLQQGLLAYGMNGHVLPRSHGAPVRALVPNRWGEVNVKWLTEIELIAGTETGYWEQRGWKGTTSVNTVAKLHAVTHRSDGTIRVGGHAYAGTRGVNRVEISTDGGQTWTDARLSEPLPGEDVWRMWRYTYDSPGTEHEVVVRAVDADGHVQRRIATAPFPSGATGWVSRTIGP